MNDKLPAQVTKIASLIGRDLAMMLVEHAHGIDGTGVVYFPRHPRPGQCLVRLVGLPAAVKLSKAYGGQTIILPKCRVVYRARRNAEVMRMSNRNIAEAVNLTERQVRNVLSP
jgi:hypothetical protein